MELLPLGTVIEVNNYKLCIIGYTSVEKENKSVVGYFVVSYPIGFTNIDKVFFIPHSNKIKVISLGYKTSSYDGLLRVLGKSFDMAQSISIKELSKMNGVIASGKAEVLEK